MRATIWINRENEVFWQALENKSGWINSIIEMLLEEDKKRRTGTEDVYEKYGNNKGEQDE